MNKTVLIVCFLVFLLPSCKEVTKKKVDLYGIQGYAQGTTFNIQYIDAENRDFQFEVDSILKAVDLSMSTWVDSSIISKINNGPAKAYLVDSIFKEVFWLSKEISRETNGAFDATLAPVIYAWGIGFSDPQKLDQAKVDSLLQFVGYDKFEMNGLELVKKIPEAKLDFNAIAQGYSVDLIADFLEEMGIGNYMVEVGGEIRASGKNREGEAWKIGIDKPVGVDEERELKGIVSLSNSSLATSGNYRKFYEVDGVKYPHTIDPRNGFPVKHNLLSVSVIAEKAAVADAYATSLMVMGTEKAKVFLNKHPDLEAYLIFPDSNNSYSSYITEGLKNEIEILE